LEWDGLLRVCFMRKNKTLQAAFKFKKILEMLKQNADQYEKQRLDEGDVIAQLGNIDMEKE
jgi:18S rRNA (adenine1779-N6/adenine1780-N6)-dimethyltransferase